MNIYDLVNSHSIAEHWKKIDYKPDSLESAWIVYNNMKLSFSEKCKYWEEIINTMPDMEIPDNECCSRSFDSLHSFLRCFMDLTRRFLVWFYNNAGCVYSVNEWSEEFRIGSVFSSAERIEQYVNSKYFEDRIRFFLKRTVIDEFQEDEDIGLHPFATIVVDKKMQAVYQKIWTYNGFPCSAEEYELLKAFNGMIFDFPIPFKKGDLLYKHREGLWPKNDKEELYVYTSLNKDTMDVVGFGQGMIGHIYKSDYQGCCMDFELYDGECDNEKRIMKALSIYEKGLISDDKFTKLYQYILMEEEMKYSIVCHFSEEILELVGINTPKEGLEEQI